MFNMRYGLLISGLGVTYLFSSISPDKVGIFYWILILIAAHILLVNFFAYLKPHNLTYTSASHLKAQKNAALGSDRLRIEPEDTKGEPVRPSSVKPVPDSGENI